VTNDIVEMLNRLNLRYKGDRFRSWSLLHALVVIPATIFLSTLFASLGHAQEFSQIKKTVFARGATVADSLEDGRRAQSGPDWDEGPPHNVRVSSFQIANRQVSMQQFANFMAGYRQRIESHIHPQFLLAGMRHPPTAGGYRNRHSKPTDCQPKPSGSWRLQMLIHSSYPRFPMAFKNGVTIGGAHTRSLSNPLSTRLAPIPAPSGFFAMEGAEASKKPSEKTEPKTSRALKSPIIE